MFLSLRYSAIDVAAFLIEECNRRGVDISHKKLQKLLYFSQGWYLALTRQKIFDEDIEAWAHGPVIPTIYKLYHHSGWQSLWMPYGGNSIHIDDKTKYFLSTILDTYGKRSADDLEKISHTELPWLEARGDLMPHEWASSIINENTMYKFFSRLKNNGKKGNAS